MRERCITVLNHMTCLWEATASHIKQQASAAESQVSTSFCAMLMKDKLLKRTVSSHARGCLHTQFGNLVTVSFLVGAGHNLSLIDAFASVQKKRTVTAKFTDADHNLSLHSEKVQHRSVRNSEQGTPVSSRPLLPFETRWLQTEHAASKNRDPGLLPSWSANFMTCASLPP